MNKLRRLLLAFVCFLLVAGLSLSSQACQDSSKDTLKLKVLVADSLILPFQSIEKGFELQYPTIDVLTEGHGSIQVIRTITEISEEADVALVADNQLIPLLMYRAQQPGGGPYADWYINFASNTLGIAYSPNSRYAAEITSANWYQIMSRPEVKLGLSDPLIDSLAYRALMSVYLAQDYYRDNSIFERFFSGSFKLPMQVEHSAGAAVIHIPEAMSPRTERIILRSYNLQILSLLESGNVDYAFEYKSVARQHKLQFLELPAQINLGSPEFAGLYSMVSVKMDFQRFASVLPEFQGSLITYAATIPTNAPHPSEAVDYLAYVLGSDGRQILKDNFQPPLDSAEADAPGRIPNKLVDYVK